VCSEQLDQAGRVPADVLFQRIHGNHINELGIEEAKLMKVEAFEQILVDRMQGVKHLW
jgi:hypothetical protein